jgi:hypothetical protein
MSALVPRARSEVKTIVAALDRHDIVANVLLRLVVVCVVSVKILRIVPRRGLTVRQPVADGCDFGGCRTRVRRLDTCLRGASNRWVGCRGERFVELLLAAAESGELGGVFEGLADAGLGPGRLGCGGWASALVAAIVSGSRWR